MSETPASERRDLQALISDMRVDVARINTRLELQTGALARLENKLDLGIFREEYERRHTEMAAEVIKVKKKADDIRDDYLRRQGANRVWRWIYSGALAALASGLLGVYLRH